MNKEREPRREKWTIEQIIALAGEETLRQGGHHPTLFIEGGQNRLVMTIEELEETHEGRIGQMRAAGWATANRNLVGTLEQVYLVTEAWLSMPGKDKAPIIPPSKDPQRKEVLIIAQLDLAQNKSDLRMLEMVRDKKDRLVSLRPYPVPEEVGMTFEMPLLWGFVEGYIMDLASRPRDDA